MSTRRGPVLRVDRIGKRFGSSTAVEDATFTAGPGRVTGFVGPNGAGKSTTLRILAGLVRPDRGSATVGGRRCRELVDPGQTIGVVLDIASAHPAMTARDHLRTYASLTGVDSDRVAMLLSSTELNDVADRRVRGFSTGMRQRLALATALLGDPDALVLDEPANGLDPAGVVWLRRFLRRYADDGGTVLVSSHALTELQQVIDDVVLIADGRTRWAGPVQRFIEDHNSLEDAFLLATSQQGGVR